jgi:hypothetical protein
MLLQPRAFLRNKHLGRIARLVCAVFFLLVAKHLSASASTLPSSEIGILIPASTLYANPASSEDDTDCFQLPPGNEDHLIKKALFANNTSSQSGTDAAPAAESAGGESASHPAFPNNRIPDWGGIWRDTAILFGAQIASIGILYVMPESVSGWSEEAKKENFKNYPKHFVNPVIDDDAFYLNYLVHPYWGATYYIRGRERGLDKVPALVYSAMLSAMYEFGVECIFEKPSIQDLIITPVAGSLVGALLFEPWRAAIKRKQELRWYDHAALVITDPIGVLSLGVEKMFGIKSTIMVDYSAPHMQNRTGSAAGASKSSRIDVSVHFPLN